jgi:hypothetical protein
MRRLGWLLTLAALLPTSAAWAEDQVFRRDAAGKETDVRGVIEAESPAGIRIKTREGVQEVPARDVRAVVYKSDRLATLEVRRPWGRESQALTTAPDEVARRRTLLEEALQLYRDLEVRSREETALHRYFVYKIAQVQALLARDDPSRLDAAAAALAACKNDLAGGWEVVPAMRLLAEILAQQGKPEAAAKAYDELAGVLGVPDELRQESRVQAVRMLLRGRKYAEAEPRLKALQAELPKQGPQRAFLDVCLVQGRMARNDLDGAEPLLQGALKTSADPDVRAAAHNLLGEYCLRKARPEEAFWHFLRVDALYEQDREEHARALYHLARLFDKVKSDPARADACHKRLLGPEFAGTAYRQLEEEGKK